MQGSRRQAPVSDFPRGFVTGLCVVLAFACERDGARPLRAVEIETRGAMAVAADDVGNDCEDVADGRICWDGSCPLGVCVVERTLPEAPAASEMGFRCVGVGTGRRCLDRLQLAGEFRCQDSVCRQSGPRLPDPGDWRCTETAGVVVCGGGEAAAGVPEAPEHPGWRCGKRGDERVCIDTSPDYPDGKPKHWTCRYEAGPPLERICERSLEPRPRFFDPCSARAPCIDGSLCASAGCILPKPVPACLFDRDCSGGVCRFGSCARRDGR